MAAHEFNKCLWKLRKKAKLLIFLSREKREKEWDWERKKERHRVWQRGKRGRVREERETERERKGGRERETEREKDKESEREKRENSSASPPGNLAVIFSKDWWVISIWQAYCFSSDTYVCWQSRQWAVGENPDQSGGVNGDNAELSAHCDSARAAVFILESRSLSDMRWDLTVTRPFCLFQEPRENMRTGRGRSFRGFWSLFGSAFEMRGGGGALETREAREGGATETPQYSDLCTTLSRGRSYVNECTYGESPNTFTATQSALQWLLVHPFTHTFIR